MADSTALPDASAPSVSASTNVIQLVAISAVCLFLEMALIRFINETVQIIAYFNNFVILATFLGLGFGALLSKRVRQLFGAMPWVLVVFLAGLILLDRLASAAEDQPDLVAWTTAATPYTLPAGPVIALVFFGCFCVFLTLGSKLGQCIERFENRLEAYSYDLLGSITGVLAFSIVSWGRYPPWVWFTLACLPLAWLLWSDGFGTRWRVPLLLVTVGLSLLVSEGYYSPYYKIHLTSFWYNGAKKPTYYSVFVDKLRIQDAIDFDQDLRATPVGTWVPYYQLPYRLRHPSHVLVLGGGSGNDTTIALKAGAQHVDTVEIDPILVEFGYSVHPQKPYADPRVHAVNDDARAFLRGGSDFYDLIVMNALDSHHQVPGLSTLRLESYIYTVQAFEDVRRHMNPQSIFVVHLSSTRPWMAERLYWSLTKAFGHEPALLTTDGSPFHSIAFVYAPAAVLAGARNPASGLLLGSPSLFEKSRATTDLATDDWPHLYLAGKRIPQVYYQVLGFILLLTLLAFRALGAARASAQNIHFLFLGASFMLLETRAITQFALLFGSTWVINAIVVTSILVVIYLGNRLLLKGLKIPKPLLYAVLFASLIGLYFLPLQTFLPFSHGPRVLSAIAMIGTPVFLASLIFSDSFRRAPHAADAFGYNLVGVVVGGALEYSSMIYGLGFLYLIALLLYVIAGLAELRSLATR